MSAAITLHSSWRFDEIRVYRDSIDQWNVHWNFTVRSSPNITSVEIDERIVLGSWSTSTHGELRDDPRLDNGGLEISWYPSWTFQVKHLGISPSLFDLSRWVTVEILDKWVIFPLFLETSAGCFAADQVCLAYDERLSIVSCWGQGLDRPPVLWKEMGCVGRDNAIWDFEKLELRMFPVTDPFVQLGRRTRGSWKFDDQTLAWQSVLAWSLLSLGIVCWVLALCCCYFQHRHSQRHRDHQAIELQ